VELFQSKSDVSQLSVSTAMKHIKTTPAKYDLNGGIDYLVSLASARNRETAPQVAKLLKERKG